MIIKANDIKNKYEKFQTAPCRIPQQDFPNVCMFVSSTILQLRLRTITRCTTSMSVRKAAVLTSELAAALKLFTPCTKNFREMKIRQTMVKTGLIWVDLQIWR